MAEKKPISEMTDEEKRARLAEIDKEINECHDKMAAIRAEDRTAFAQDLLDRLFREFDRGAAWLERMKKNAVEKQHVYSPIGRRRNLYATLIADRKTQARQTRRGVNAPIQGIASEQGTESNRAIDVTYYMEAPVMYDMLDLDESNVGPLETNRIVHDASYFTSDYDMVLPLIHIVQHEATYGSAERFDKNFGLKFTIEPEIEIEISAQDDKTYTWDWTLNGLMDCIDGALTDAEDLGLLEGTREEAMKRILKPWMNKDAREYLHTNYPLLGVPEVQHKVRDAIKYARTKLQHATS